MKTLVRSLTLMVMAVLVFSSYAPPAYKVGDMAKDFKLKNVDGKFVSLSDYRESKGVIVIFTCNHCPYAKAYEQRIMDLDKQYRSKGFPVVAISPNDPAVVPDDSFEKMAVRSKEKGYTFPYLFDETQQVARDFGAMKTPHVYVLNKTQKGFDVAYIGAIDDSAQDPSLVKVRYVEDAVNALLAGQKVPVTETKAIGCSIKWKS